MLPEFGHSEIGFTPSGGMRFSYRLPLATSLPASISGVGKVALHLAVPGVEPTFI